MSDANRRHGACPSCQTGGGFLRKIARNEAANVLPLVAVGTLVLAGLVGGGVDMARAYQAERRLQAACDAGVLAGRRAVTTGGWNAGAEAQADIYFDANFSEEEQGTTGTNFEVDSPDDGDTVNGTAAANLGTIIMGVFGFESMDLSVTCSASMGIGNSDIMFVLDNTGSMAWTPEGYSTSDYEDTRMFALEGAMMTFYDTVAASNPSDAARIRYGFVPYSSSVNVGHLLMELDSTYIADSVTIQSRQAVNWGPVVDEWSGEGEDTEIEIGDYQRTGSRYSKKSSCQAAEPADETEWTIYGSPYETTRTDFDPAREQAITAIGTQQDYRMAQYKCQYYEEWQRENGNWVEIDEGWYIARRYQTKTITSYDYEARDPVPVTGAGESFDDWLYRPVNYDTTTYKTFASVQLPVSESSGLTANNASHTWEGCIMERATTSAASFSFVSLETGISPYSFDLDIDLAPTSDVNTKWTPLWPEATYRRSTLLASLNGETYDGTGNPPPNWWRGADYYRYSYCPYQAQLLTEMDRDAFEDYVLAMTPVGSTYHDFGLLWGARLSSPTGIFSSNVTAAADNGGTVSRHVIFMTDGELAPTLSVNSSYGIERLDQRITGDGDSDQYDRHESRYLAICEAIKARGIRLWVIAFGESVELSDELELDADEPGDTGCSSPDSAFKAENAEQLNQQFQEIAKQVGELRIVQ